MSIQLFLTGWLICIIALNFIKLKWAVALFLAYLMLVPYINLGIPGLGSGDNLIKLILFISLFVEAKRKNKNLSLTPFFPFFIYFVISLFIIPFQSKMPVGEMMVTWRKDVMNVLFLPIVIWNTMLIDQTSVKLFRNTMLICILIAIGYGLFLTQLNGVNPYVMLILTFIDSSQDYESYYEAAGSGRLFGRISSVFIHPMSFGLFIGLSFIYLFFLINFQNFKKGLIYLLLILATFIMAVLCGVRSVLGGLIVAFLYYFIVGRNYKGMFIAFLGGLLGLAILSMIPELSDYVTSIADVKNEKGTVGGSSIEMRLAQLGGAIEEASSNPLFGLGYGWTNYYQSINGDHPICLAFESLIFVIICNSGIMGIFLWLYMVMRFFKINKSFKLRKLFVINSLMVFYISYSCITGEYAYMKTFLIFYTLMIGESFFYSNNQSFKINKVM